MNQNLPDATGHFGEFGGRYAPETLMSPLLELEDAYMSLTEDAEFQEEFQYYLREYVGRPNPLYYAEGLTQALGGAKIYLKREDLNHTGAHKINNTIGQILLARRMGKDRIIAETGAGQHGVATANRGSKVRYGMRSLYGRGRYSETSPERFSHEIVGYNGDAGQLWLMYPQGRNQRRFPRLGDECSDDILSNRICRGSPPVSDDRPRFSSRHRSRSQITNP